MKLSALLLLAAAASTCVAQSVVTFQSAAPSSTQSSTVGIVDDQALSRAAAETAAAARLKELQKMMDRVNEANCPVALTSAWLTPRLMLLDTSSGSTGNSLDLEFRNTSGKPIRSMELSARILVKRSIYDLNYLPPLHVYLTSYGTKSVDSTFAELRHLSLPEGIHPALIDGVTLEQVTFEDGSVWASRGDQYCRFSPNQSLPVAR